MAEQLLLAAEKLSEMAVFNGYRGLLPGPRPYGGVEAGDAGPVPRPDHGLRIGPIYADAAKQ